MCDISIDFLECCGACGDGSGGFSLEVCASPSTLIVKATELLQQIEANEQYLRNVFEDYVDYHRYLRGCNQAAPSSSSYSTSLTDDERNRVGKEVALFVAGVVSDVQELRRAVRTLATRSAITLASNTHYEEILSHISKRLDELTKHHKQMQRERDRMTNYKNPFRLLTGSLDSTKFATSSTLAKLTDAAENPHLDDVKKAKQAQELKQQKRNLKLKQQNQKLDDDGSIPLVFAERYQSEVAKPSILKKYDNIVNRQKASLMKEAKHLTVRFSEELQEVTSAEAISMQLSSMLTDFIGILSEQSEQVEIVSGSGKAATTTVKETDAELQLTLERTESHQKNMVLLAVSLSLLLLLLDWISP